MAEGLGVVVTAEPPPPQAAARSGNTNNKRGRRLFIDSAVTFVFPLCLGPTKVSHFQADESRANRAQSIGLDKLPMRCRFASSSIDGVRARPPLCQRTHQLLRPCPHHPLFLRLRMVVPEQV